MILIQQASPSVKLPTVHTYYIPTEISMLRSQYDFVVKTYKKFLVYHRWVSEAIHWQTCPVANVLSPYHPEGSVKFLMKEFNLLKKVIFESFLLGILTSIKCYQ